MSKVIGFIDRLEYVPNSDKHTVSYAEKSRELEKSFNNFPDHKLSWVLADSIDQFRDKLSIVAENYLRSCYWNPDPADFIIHFRFENILKDGTFYYPSCIATIKPVVV